MRKIFILLLFITFYLFINNQIIYAADETTVEHPIAHEWQGGGDPLGLHEDDSSTTYELPFSFYFYGIEYTTLYISTNGYVGFNDIIGEDYMHTMWKYEDLTIDMHDETPRIFALGDDLTTSVYQPTYLIGNDIYITENTDNVVVRWQAQDRGTRAPVSAELVLFSNGDFQINYGDNENVFDNAYGVAVGIGDGQGIEGKHTASVMNGLTNSGSEFNNPQSFYWGDLANIESNPDATPSVTFNKDKRCLWGKPEGTTWIKMEKQTVDGVHGLNLSWVQYGADKINIKIDDGTGSFPWEMTGINNDGREFLPNVQSWQKIMFKPVNHCRNGEYGMPVSLDTFPTGWYNVE